MSGKLSEWVLSYGYSQASQAYQDQVQAVFILEHDHCAHVLGSTQTGEIRHFHFFKEVHFFRKKKHFMDRESKSCSCTVHQWWWANGRHQPVWSDWDEASSIFQGPDPGPYISMLRVGSRQLGINHRLAPGPQPCV